MLQAYLYTEVEPKKAQRERTGESNETQKEKFSFFCRFFLFLKMEKKHENKWNREREKRIHQTKQNVMYYLEMVH